MKRRGMMGEFFKCLDTLSGIGGMKISSEDWNEG